MRAWARLSRKLKKSRLRVGLPFISYEIGLEDLISSETVDERIARLGQIKRELGAAIMAVSALQDEAGERKAEVDQLQELVAKLQEDKNAAESLLQVPEESLVRLMSRATSKGRARGLAEGAIIGFLTGALSSLLVWYLTN